MPADGGEIAAGQVELHGRDDAANPDLAHSGMTAQRGRASFQKRSMRRAAGGGAR